MAKVTEIKIFYNMSYERNCMNVTTIGNPTLGGVPMVNLMIPQIGSQLKMNGLVWKIGMVKYDYDKMEINVNSTVYQAEIEKARAEKAEKERKIA